MMLSVSVYVTMNGRQISE